MKIQIAHLSPHQNAKVFAVLMALSSFIFVIPMSVGFLFFPTADQHGNPIEGPPILIFLLFPLMYLVMGYVMVLVACKFYNFMFKYVGGIEYESREQ